RNLCLESIRYLHPSRSEPRDFARLSRVLLFLRTQFANDPGWHCLRHMVRLRHRADRARRVGLVQAAARWRCTCRARPDRRRGRRRQRVLTIASTLAERLEFRCLRCAMQNRSSYGMGFRSLAAEITNPMALSATARLPPWLTGTLLRTGPAKFEVGT